MPQERSICCSGVSHTVTEAFSGYMFFQSFLGLCLELLRSQNTREKIQGKCLLLLLYPKNIAKVNNVSFILLGSISLQYGDSYLKEGIVYYLSILSQCIAGILHTVFNKCYWMLYILFQNQEKKQ